MIEYSSTDELDEMPDIKGRSVVMQIEIISPNDVIKQEQLIETADYNCTICMEQFADKNDLYVHIKTHFKPLICQICRKKLIGDQQYDYHMKTTHKTEENVEPMPVTEIFKCNICLNVYETSLAFKTHLNECNLQSTCCEICGRLCRDTNALKLHLITHTNQKAFVCDLCGKSFTKKANLIYHLNTHTGTRPYGCDLCGKKFAHRSGLICHTRSHTGDRPYKCPYCERHFRHSTDLRRHRRSHGYEERRFACYLCEMKFYENKFLQAHVKSHKKVMQVSD